MRNSPASAPGSSTISRLNRKDAMDASLFFEFLYVAGFILYFVPTIIARLNRMRVDRFLLVSLANILIGWTVIGWFYLLRQATSSGWPYRAKDPPPPPPVQRDDTGLVGQVEACFARPIAWFMELPPSRERILTFRLPNGRGIRLVDDLERPLTLVLDGPWTAEEKRAAQALLQAEVETRPHLTRLVDPEEPLKGLVFRDRNQFSASALVYRLTAEALGADPANLELERNYEHHDARPEIAALLDATGQAELLHEASGVRIVVELDGLGKTAGEANPSPGYRLEVPVDSLDPKRGQRHRARQAILETRWRQAEGDDVPIPANALADDDTSWGFQVDHGDSNDAADAALRLFCTIADQPIDVRVRVVRPMRP